MRRPHFIHQQTYLVKVIAAYVSSRQEKVILLFWHSVELRTLQPHSGVSKKSEKESEKTKTQEYFLSEKNWPYLWTISRLRETCTDSWRQIGLPFHRKGCQQYHPVYEELDEKTGQSFPFCDAVALTINFIAYRAQATRKAISRGDDSYFFLFQGWLRWCFFPEPSSIL